MHTRRHAGEIVARSWSADGCRYLPLPQPVPTHPRDRRSAAILLANLGRKSTCADLFGHLPVGIAKRSALLYEGRTAACVAYSSSPIFAAAASGSHSTDSMTGVATASMSGSNSRPPRESPAPWSVADRGGNSTAAWPRHARPRTAAPGSRADRPRSSSSTSGFRFCGMIDEPVVSASGNRAKPNSLDT